MTGKKRRRSGEDGARSALRRRRRRRRIRQGIAWTVLGVLGLAVGLGLSFGWSTGLAWIRENTEILDVRSVDAAPTETVEPWEIVNASGVVPGDDLLELPVDDVIARLERLPRVRRSRVDRRFGGRVTLRVEERRPHAVLLGTGLLEIDETGVLLGPPSDWSGSWLDGEPAGAPRGGVDLPLLTGVGTDGLEPGSRLDHDGVLQALGFLSRLELYGWPGADWISEIDAGQPEGLVVYTLEGALPIRVGDGRVSRQKIHALIGVLEELEERAIPVRYLDLRFHDMVVVKKG